MVNPLFEYMSSPKPIDEVLPFGVDAFRWNPSYPTPPFSNAYTRLPPE